MTCNQVALDTLYILSRLLSAPKSIICLKSGRKTGLWLHFLMLHS
jgi:hypothetical protein